MQSYMNHSANSGLSVARNLKIALFHLGSGMVDVLATGVWNRIMVADLGFSATIVGLLTGLRYFLAPLGVIAGRYSDRHAIGGFRRLFWIWLGRAMMALSTVSLGFATAELARRFQAGISATTPAGLWLTLIISFLLFSLGSAISGSTFLALIYDRALERQRGRAVGLVWTFLLIGFAAGGVFFSILLPPEEGSGELGFSADSVFTLFVVTAAVLAALWFFSLLGEEKRHSSPAQSSAEPLTSLRRDLSLVWRSRLMRFFLLYLSLSMLFTFLQDTVLEPFAGQVFGMEAHITNRFAAYWGGTAIIGSFIVLFLAGRLALFSNRNLSLGGVAILLLAYAVFAISALGEQRAWVTPGLVLLGLGMGLWNIGTLGLMMQMSPAGRAGTFLGFWTLCVTFARGAGVAGGGIIRDIMLSLTGQHNSAYGAVFCCGFLGLLLSLAALWQVKERRAPLRADAPVDALLSQALD